MKRKVVLGSGQKKRSFPNKEILNQLNKRNVGVERLKFFDTKISNRPSKNDNSTLVVVRKHSQI